MKTNAAARLGIKIQAGRGTGYGAGVLFCAEDTGRFLFLKRGPDGDYADTWCGPGGGVEDHETVEQAVRRECQEEIGYSEPYDLHHMERSNSDGFCFHNHLAFVPTEFVPVLNDEHTAYVWTDDIPEPCHPGLRSALDAYIQRNRAAGEKGDPDGPA